MENKYYEAMKKRRSIYALAKESTISDEQIRKIVEHSLDYTPSAFNSQSSRVVLLLGEEHDKLWNITENSLRQIVPEDQFGPTKDKMDSFGNAYGTLLFFEDYQVIEDLQSNFEMYKDNFPIWSHQSSGMLQYNIWTSLAVEGLGASLQHYNELIEQEVKKEWSLPSKWKIIGQMPFGKPIEGAGDKEIVGADKKLKVFGSK